MDALITAAARALAAGDPLGALNRVALRDDAPALALRGIAMAQLGDLARARLLVRRAARAFGQKEAVARARCVVAEAEIALVSRDLGWPAKALGAAHATLAAHGDFANAAHARQLEIRHLRADWPPRRGRGCARHARSHPLPARLARRARADRGWHRPAPAAHASRARGPRPGQSRRAPGRHSGLSAEVEQAVRLLDRPPRG